MLTRESVECDNELPSVIKCHGAGRGGGTLAFRLKVGFSPLFVSGNALVNTINTLIYTLVLFEINSAIF
jgi:hypothetical protein